MAFRVVLIESDVAIHIKLNNLVVTKEENDIWIPLDDISIIVIDNLSSSITFRVMDQLAEYGIAMVVCDQKHVPIGYYGAYDNHVRSTKILGYQIASADEIYDDLWKIIIETKILNQAKAYYKLKKDEVGKNAICNYSMGIVAGDKTNREAHAAKVYFNLLMGSSFSRGNDNILLNSGLDYGYAILRSYLARLCVGYGLNTQIGVHHRNEYNRFNLVDDLIEPFRPFVDIMAFKLLNDAEYFLPEHRRALVNIPNLKIFYNNKKMYLGNALAEYVEQFVALLLGKIIEMEFPDIDYFMEEEDEI